MDKCVRAGSRKGEISVPASKSYAHRLLICFALSGEGGRIRCDGISRDIRATIDCLNAMGAAIDAKDDGNIDVRPIGFDKLSGKQSTRREEGYREMRCGESGSTLRFLIPVVGALGEAAEFYMEGKLSQRPIGDLTDELSRHGMDIYREGSRLKCSGRLTSGTYNIPGSISSQFVSGLLFALPMLKGRSIINITGGIESAGYISMTEDVIGTMGISFGKRKSGYEIQGDQIYTSGGSAEVEKDWSNAAFFLCMGAFSKEGVILRGMPGDSKQGDRNIVDILRGFGADISLEGGNISVRRSRLRGQTIDASEVPDLVPTVSVVAACAEGTTKIINAERLRYKESDRLESTAKMLRALGACVEERRDSLIIEGKDMLDGGIVDAMNDHRIAMAAAAAAGCCRRSVNITGAECVSKSYPDFWKDLKKLEVET